jgi:hypothetical protein
LSRLPGLDRWALEATLDEVEFSGVVHVVGDDGEPPLTIGRGLADRANAIPNRAGKRFGAASADRHLGAGPREAGARASSTGTPTLTWPSGLDAE